MRVFGVDSVDEDWFGCVVVLSDVDDECFDEFLDVVWLGDVFEIVKMNFCENNFFEFVCEFVRCGALAALD